VKALFFLGGSCRSSACRAWRPVAQLLLHSRWPWERGGEKMLIVVYQLDSVFGPSRFRISLSLGLSGISKVYSSDCSYRRPIPSPPYISLILVWWGWHVPILCYETLRTFSLNASWYRRTFDWKSLIRNDLILFLKLLRDEFNRLPDSWCCIDLLWAWRKSFIENTLSPISPFVSIRIKLFRRSEDIEIVDTCVEWYAYHTEGESCLCLLPIWPRFRNTAHVLEYFSISLKDDEYFCRI
jgi:hypothetical protein